MAADEGDWITRMFEEGTPIDEAIVEAVRKARQEHKRAGNPVAEWREGKVVWIAPEDIEADEKP